jgi:phage terminase large subunit-like protein
MASAALDLQKAVFAALGGDASLTTLLGGPKLHDMTPAAVSYPYLTFGRTSGFDWSTGTEPGEEQIFTIHVWSKAKGRSEALQIAARVREVLEAGSLELESHNLVLLDYVFSEVRHDEDLAVQHGLVRFRALLEPKG